MTPLDLPLPPAQWEHLDRHGWTLTVAPTPVQLPDAAGAYPVGPAAPVPATMPCPECAPFGGEGMQTAGEVDYNGEPVWWECDACSGSGVVPRTVGIVRPERPCPCYPLTADEDCATCPGIIPAEQVGTATVTPVPVVQFLSRGPGHEPDPPWTPCNEDYILPFPMVRTNHDSTIVMLHPGLSEATHDVAALFATPPVPGATVWRLDKENDRD